MGSKNRIYLGMLTALILHYIRNKYTKEIFLSKRVYTKIKQKHSDMLVYTNKAGFTLLLENTVAVIAYPQTVNADNFIACIDGTYILYALKREKHHTSCSTMFKLKPSTLRKYYNDDTFKMLQKSHEDNIREYMN